MVGEFLQQAFRTNTLDGRDRFIDEEAPSVLGDAMNGVRGWVRDLFGRDVPPPPEVGADPVPQPQQPLPPGSLPPVIRDGDPYTPGAPPGAMGSQGGQGGAVFGGQVPLTPTEAAANPVPGVVVPSATERPARDGDQ
jgi:penicillin-binding protein 1A